MNSNKKGFTLIEMIFSIILKKYISIKMAI